MNTGPYVDNLVFKVISNQEQRILALQAGEIEFDTSFFDPVHLDTLAADPDIDIFSALRNGYGHITINCRDAPLNESVLRRAFAFAFDKTAVTVEIMDGFSQEHDSIVPYPNGWCVEDEFDWHYYTDQSAIGNAILNASGLFPYDGGTGFRTYRGDPFNIVIEYASSSPEIAGGTAQIGVDALLRLGIDAETRAADFNEYISRLDSHGEYDMVFYAQNFYSNDVDWLAYEYWSDYADVEYQNPSNFANTTYDSWRDQLLYGTTYEEVYEAAAEMQKILQYNVPRLVVYENTYMQGYRNDQFTGHVEDLGRYISGPWTMRKIHKLDGSPGGSVPIALPEEPDSFNIFVTNSPYSTTILENLYSSLYKYGPDLNPWPDLAESILTETHTDNVAVPEGHTRYTIDIIQNATWSDGTPLTAEDVAFTYMYMYESAVYGNPAGVDLGDLVAVYAPTVYRVVIEFNTESYWQFSNFAFDYIIPKHIFNNSGGIGYSGWNTWNPVFDPAEPHVTSGPFLFTDYEAGEFYEISKNPDYYYAPEVTTTTTTIPTTSTSTTVTINPPPVVVSATGATYVEGTSGHIIYWDIYDDNPLLYMVYLDNVLNDTGTWDGSDITINVDGHSVGTYNYTLYLIDYSGNFVYSTVYVTVLPPSSGGGTTTTTTSDTTTEPTGGITLGTITLLISIASIGVIVVVVIVIIKSKS
jgi:ABC-type transport system substrate-binding protein